MEVAVVMRGQVRFFDDLGRGAGIHAEWLALLMAAEIAREAGAARVLLRGDALAVIEQAGGKSKCRDAFTQEMRRRYLALIAGLPEVKLRWVRRGQNLAGIALARRREELP